MGKYFLAFGFPNGVIRRRYTFCVEEEEVRGRDAIMRFAGVSAPPRVPISYCKSGRQEDFVISSRYIRLHRLVYFPRSYVED